jgi:hypothetical protein
VVEVADAATSREPRHAFSRVPCLEGVGWIEMSDLSHLLAKSTATVDSWVRSVPWVASHFNTEGLAKTAHIYIYTRYTIYAVYDQRGLTGQIAGNVPS